MKTSKVIHFDKLVTLVIDKQEDCTFVSVNWVRLIHLEGMLQEEVDTLTVKQAKEIEAKYTKNENWQFSQEDIEAIQEEVKAYTVRKPVTLLIGDTNVLDYINWLSIYLTE